MVLESSLITEADIKVSLCDDIYLYMYVCMYVCVCLYIYLPLEWYQKTLSLLRMQKIRLYGIYTYVFMYLSMNNPIYVLLHVYIHKPSYENDIRKHSNY
jgi:hypothetical protein